MWREPAGHRDTREPVRTGDVVQRIEGSWSGALAFLADSVMQGVSSSRAVKKAPEKDLTDTLIEDTRPGSDGEGGFAVTAVGGASLVASRVRAQLALTGGVHVLQPGTMAALTDAQVENVMPPASQGGLYGNGIVVSAGARLTGSRVRVAAAHDTG
jgi:hypothetical protein